MISTINRQLCLVKLKLFFSTLWVKYITIRQQLQLFLQNKINDIISIYKNKDKIKLKNKSYILSSTVIKGDASISSIPK
jgi:hypothetical protein